MTDANKVPFLTSINGDINYGTVSPRKNIENDITTITTTGVGPVDMGSTGVGSKILMEDDSTKPMRGKMFETYKTILLKGLDENYLLYLKGHGLAERDIIDDG